MIDTFSCGHTEYRREGIAFSTVLWHPCAACQKASGAPSALADIKVADFQALKALVEKHPMRGGQVLVERDANDPLCTCGPSVCAHCQKLFAEELAQGLTTAKPSVATLEEVCPKCLEPISLSQDIYPPILHCKNGHSWRGTPKTSAG